jgi:vitamin-K-epoxide reductase (warfarin-sensitive)
MIISIFVVALVGFGISLYTYLLEEKIKRVPDYKPVCDISDRISCTKPMKSPYATLFYFSNAIVGMVFYALVALLALLEMHKLLIILIIAGCVVSCVLAYLLYFKIKSLCLLCTSLYIINGILLFLSLRSL